MRRSLKEWRCQLVLMMDAICLTDPVRNIASLPYSSTAERSEATTPGALRLDSPARAAGSAVIVRARITQTLLPSSKDMRVRFFSKTASDSQNMRQRLSHRSARDQHIFTSLRRFQSQCLSAQKRAP
jgi:hypothetical protein